MFLFFWFLFVRFFFFDVVCCCFVLFLLFCVVSCVFVFVVCFVLLCFIICFVFVLLRSVLRVIFGCFVSSGRTQTGSSTCAWARRCVKGTVTGPLGGGRGIKYRTVAGMFISNSAHF